MKKIMAFLLASVLFILVIVVAKQHYAVRYEAKITEVGKSLCYAISLERNNAPQAIANVLDKDTILLLGSSELPYYNEESHPKMVTHNGNSDFNIMELGVGYNQSLMHAINVGGLAPFIENQKVVLNLSPQWFTEAHIDPAAFASRFSDRMLDAFMKNKDISKETKEKVAERCGQLFGSNQMGSKLVQDCEKVYVSNSVNPLKSIAVKISSLKNEIQSQKELLRPGILPENTGESEQPFVKFSEVDFEELMKEAEAQGKAQCTNNDFYIYDDYYNQYIKPVLAKQKDSAGDLSYCDSPEYGDLKLFLEVCKETGLDVMLINIPVNGYWYDYTGFPKEDRQQYYQNIRDIVAEYGVALLDLSEHEYTPYFLKDVMHLGWKGWVYLDEGIYEFYKKDHGE